MFLITKHWILSYSSTEKKKKKKKKKKQKKKQKKKKKKKKKKPISPLCSKYMYRQYCLVVTQHYRRHLCKLFTMLQSSQRCCERTHDCACTVVVAVTHMRCFTNGSDHANLIWLFTSEVLPPSAIRKHEVIVNIFFSVVQQLSLAVGRLIVEVSRSHTDRQTHTHTHTHTHTPINTRQDSSKRVISSSQRMRLTQRTTHSRDEHPCPQRDSNPQSRNRATA